MNKLINAVEDLTLVTATRLHTRVANTKRMQKERLKLLPFRKNHHPLPLLQTRKEERLKVQYGGDKGRLANTIAGGKDEAQEMLFFADIVVSNDICLSVTTIYIHIYIYIYIGVCEYISICIYIYMYQPR